MWASFKEMPTLLKFLTGHSLACIFLMILSIIPHNSFAIEGHSVSYAVWWSSGAGPFASLLGIIMPVSGYLLLQRSHRARISYLTALSVGLIAPYLLCGQFGLAAFGIALVAAIGWYLYGRQTVQTYFASN
jgi:hypothetical protein